jgi:hypothetical protein
MSLEHVKDPRMLPVILSELAAQGAVAVHLNLRWREQGLLGQVTDIAEMIGVSDDEPFVNPLWRWHEPAGELRFNPGCVTELTPAMRERFLAAGIEFPIPAAAMTATGKSRWRKS